MSALAEAFRNQGMACANLGSPFMGRLCSALADIWPEDTALAAKCRGFTGDIGPAGVSLPLRIAGGLHALRLRGETGLEDVYPPHDPEEAAFRAALDHALHERDAFLTEWIESPPQTNEIRRSAALIPGACVAADLFDLPIWLSELGASGGLNLMWDRFALQGEGWRRGPIDAVVTLTPDWTGAPPPATDPVIVARRGVDLNPLDPANQTDLLRLTSFLWPDQPERLQNTRAAASAMQVQVDRGDAIDWLQDRFAAAPEGHLHLVQNTVAWQYFPEDVQARGRQLFAAFGAQATATRPLAWLQLETDGDLHAKGGAALTLQTWPSGQIIQLGRADFHGRWVNWTYDGDTDGTR